VSEAARQGRLALVHALPAVWRAKTTTHAERKPVGRLLLQDVRLTKREKAVRVDVRWQTQACSPLDVPRPQPAYVVRRTAPEVLECIRQGAPDHRASASAERLNQEGSRSGQGGAFTARKVEWRRYAYRIKSGCPLGPAACPRGQRGEGRYRARTAAARRNVTVYTIADWCTAGKLDGVPVAPRGPWWVQRTPELIAALRQPVRP